MVHLYCENFIVFYELYENDISSWITYLVTVLVSYIHVTSCALKLAFITKRRISTKENNYNSNK